MWLSVPVNNKGHMAGLKLKDLRIDNALPGNESTVALFLNIIVRHLILMK